MIQKLQGMSTTAIKLVAFMILFCLPFVARAASPDNTPPTEAGVSEIEPKQNPAPSTDNSRAGSSAKTWWVDKYGGGWTELPRPDASWSSLADKKDRKSMWNLSQEGQDKILHSRA